MSLEGDLSELPFAEIVQLYGTGRQPVAVHLVPVGSTEGEGVFCLEEGKLTDARLGRLTGREAFRQALRMQEGQFRVEMGVRASSGAKPELLTHLLLDELARLEEDKASGAYELKPQRTPPPVIVAPRRPNHTPLPINIKATPLPQAATPQPQPAPAAAPAAPAVPAKKPPLVLLAAVAGAVVLVGAVAAVALSKKDAAAAPGKDVPRPAPRVVRGVSAGEIVLGMAAPLNGPHSELGLSMKMGVELAFEQANDAGGVHGRKLRLLTLDDRNDPDTSARLVQELVEQRQVFAVVGDAGTGTTPAALPALQASHTLLFGPASGSRALRKEPPDRYVFNVRASLAEETGAAVRWLLDKRKVPADAIAVFAQDDEFGESGFVGVAEALKKRGRDAGQVLRVGYPRNTVDVAEAVAKLKASPGVKAVVMVATAEPAARVVDQVRDFAPSMIFTSVSAADGGGLADRLKEAKVAVAGDVLVTRVVPGRTSKAPVVERFRKLAEEKAVAEQVGALSVEGYVVGSLLVEALRRAGPDVDTEKLVAALEGLRDVDLGTGTKLGFGPREHQASHKVWGTVLDASWTYQPVELE